MNSRQLPTNAVFISSLVVVLSLAVISLGCGPTKEASKPAEEQPVAEAKVYQPTGEEGSVTGKINFEGQPEKLRPISMDADAVCAAKHSKPVYPEVVVVNSNGTLRNVFVYVKSGLDGKAFAVPDQPMVLDQDGCLYKPHVVGIQARQNLKVVSSDKTTHNIHPMPKVNPEWNVSQSPGADPIMKSFNRPEVGIPVKCNQHPWMRAYIYVLGHPFYGVSGEDGTFELKGLPPGKYEIEAVHEQYGALTQQVTVEAKKPTAIELKYKAKQAHRQTSLEMLPALVLPCCGGE